MAIIFFNIRADRARELTRALTDKSFINFPTHPLHLDWMITFVSYQPDFPVDVLLKKSIVHDTLFDVLELAEKHIFTIAETREICACHLFF